MVFRSETANAGFLDCRGRLRKFAMRSAPFSTTRNKQSLRLEDISCSYGVLEGGFAHIHGYLHSSSKIAEASVQGLFSDARIPPETTRWTPVRPAEPPNPSHLCRIRGRQPATRALHKRLAPGRCVERRAAQKDARRARRGRQRRSGRRRGQTRPTSQPTGGGGGRQPRAGGCAGQTRQNEHVLHEEAMQHDECGPQLVLGKDNAWDIFMNKLEAVSLVWSGLGTDSGAAAAAEEATAAVPPLFPPAQREGTWASPLLSVSLPPAAPLALPLTDSSI